MEAPRSERRLRRGAYSPTTAWLARGALAAAVALVGARGLGQDHLDRMPRPDETLPGRATPIPLPARHLVYGTPLDAAPAGTERAYFGMGCFWGAEQYFFRTPGVVSTAV